MGASQNQRLVAGPGPTLATYPVKGRRLSRQTPQLVSIGNTENHVINALHPRQRVYMQDALRFKGM